MSETPGAPKAFDTAEWAGESGRRWRASLDGLERMIAPIGAAILARAGYAGGERVVDIGCGGGWTSLEIARAVGPQGAVVGLDVSAELVGVAAGRAAAAGAGNVRFEVGDAAAALPAAAPFDRLFSRFGVMFFPDPRAAFANLRRMVRAGGRLDIAVWAPVADNPWAGETMEVVKRHVALPPPVPRAPGPFALGETDYLRDLLTSGGFADVDIAPWSGLQHVGGPGATPEAATAFVIDSMHVGDHVRNGAPAVAAAIRADLLTLFARHATPGGVALPAKAWFARAAAR